MRLGVEVKRKEYKKIILMIVSLIDWLIYLKTAATKNELDLYEQHCFPLFFSTPSEWSTV